MITEISAGGVVYQKKGSGFQLLLLKDRKGEWTFPKGLVEKNEDTIVTAQREIAEEVGLTNTKFIAELDPVNYFYKREGKLIKKTVHYYLFQFTGSDEPVGQKEEGIREVKWFSPKEALEIVGYRKTNKKVLEMAIELITQKN